MFPSLVTCSSLVLLCDWRLSQHQTLSQSIGPAFMDFTKCFNVVTSNLYLVYFVPQRDLCTFCCECEIELTISRISFYQIMLCLNYA